MSDPDHAVMRTIRFESYGEPRDVLRLDHTDIPTPAPDRVRVRVHACGLTPADWALCRGLFPGNLPRGIGLEVSGTVDAVGGAVTNVVGDLVLGVPDLMAYASAGASDFAVLSHWTPVPDGLNLNDAAALPMAVETAFRSLDLLGVGADRTVLINGAGTTVGFAAAQMALLRGARVIATAGKTYAGRLRHLGANVTSYGAGVVERVEQIAGGRVDLVLDTAPVGGTLPDLVRIAGGDPQRVLTISHFEEAAKLGVRDTGREAGVALRYDVLGDFAKLAAEGKFAVPISGIFGMQDWRRALDLSLSGRAGGKLLILPGRPFGAQERHDMGQKEPNAPGVRKSTSSRLVR